MDNPATSAARLLVSDAWIIWYEADRAFVDVEPDEDDPVWTSYLTGLVASDAAYSILTLTDLAEGTGQWYEISDVRLDQQAITCEFRVKVDASGGAVDEGAFVEIADGQARFRVWLRDDGFNIENEAAVAADLSGWHVFRFVSNGQAVCSLYLDGALAQTGLLAGFTDDYAIRFGTEPGAGYATTQWDRVRARLLSSVETAYEGGTYVTISGTFVITDLEVGQTALEIVDHSGDAEFSFCEYPTLTFVGGASLEAAGIIATVIADTDGSGFVVEIYNDSYSEYGYYYGGSAPDIQVAWTRRGLV